jgi:hypothetical protein
MGYDVLEYAELRLRENGIRRIYVDKERTKNKEYLLCVDTDYCHIGVWISTYKQTRSDLEKELSLQVNDVRQIRVALEYFDNNWNEIDEYVKEPSVKGGQEE